MSFHESQVASEASHAKKCHDRAKDTMALGPSKKLRLPASSSEISERDQEERIGLDL